MSRNHTNTGPTRTAGPNRCGFCQEEWPCHGHRLEEADARRAAPAIEREAQGIPPDASADLREAAMYALGFMNDPEGLAEKREEWRDNLRAALHAEAQSIPRPSYPTPEEFAAMSQEQFVAFLDRIGVRRGIPLIDVELLRESIVKAAAFADGLLNLADLAAAEYTRLASESSGDHVAHPPETHEEQQQRLRREEEDRL